MRHLSIIFDLDGTLLDTLAFVALTIHLSHGFWSMLQTFGVNHPRYNILIARLSLIIPIFFLLIFGGIAFYFMSGLGASF